MSHIIWVIHLGPSTFILLNGPLLYKWPSTLAQDRPLLDEPSTFAHWDHFRSSTLDLNLWTELRSVVRTVNFIYFWTVQFTSFWRVHCRYIEPSTVCLLRLTLSTFVDRPLLVYCSVHFWRFELSTYTSSRFRYEYRCSSYNVIKMKIHGGRL